MSQRVHMVVAFALVSAVAAGCSSKREAGTTSASMFDRIKNVADEAAASKNEEVITARVEDDRAPNFGPIYFGFNSDSLTPESRDALARLGDYMKKNRGARVTISGHADERGTTEYNLALGDRRANAARDFLVRMGVDRSRVSVVSYGEERPAVRGTGEAAWARNRRDEFEITSSVAANP